MGPPGAAGIDLGSTAAPNASAFGLEERVPAAGAVPPMGTAEAEAALARAVAAGAAALLERGDAQRTCTALQGGLLQVRAHRRAAIEAQVAGCLIDLVTEAWGFMSARPAPHRLLCASIETALPTYP